MVLALIAATTDRVSAQQFTVEPATATPEAASGLAAASGTLRTAPDFATDVLGDPWDFEQSGDYVYMFSTDWADSDKSAWASIPAIANGKFSGVSRVSRPRIQMQFEGVYGALNIVGRNGVRFPIDSSKYKRLSIRMKRSQMPADWFWLTWYTLTNRSGGMGTRISPTYGYDTRQGKYANQSEVSKQSLPNVWHIYKFDLDAAVDPGQTSWTAATVRGLSMDLGHSDSLVGATIELDWVRLTERGQAMANLSFSGYGGPVTVTARHTETGDVIQVFPDNGASTTFPDNSSFTWDYGFLSPGTWTLTATGNGRTLINTIVVDPAPYIDVLDPDAKGGRDFGRSVVGDAYDMTNAEDVTRDGSTNQLTSIAYGETGMTANTTGTSGTACPGAPCPDPAVAVLGSPYIRAGTQRNVDGSTYRHLTFTIEHDRKHLTANQALLRQYGSVLRVIWQAANRIGQGYTDSQDIFVLDGGPYTYSMDLATFTQAGQCDTCQVENNGTQHAWSGPMSTLRFDPYESDTVRWFRLADVRIAADDEPNANGYFPIRWQVNDATFSREVGAASPAGSDATVTLYYDTDTNPTNGRAVIATVAAASGIYNWNVAGLNVGRYFVYATVTDTAGNSMSRYSGGPVGITSVFAPPTDTSATGMPDAWRARYELTNPSDDADGDGISNLAEYQQATNPLVSNVWMMPEGATGFFTERIALANPDPTPANVTLTFLRKAAAGQSPPPPIVRDYTVLGNARLTVTANQVAGLGTEEFSTVVTAVSGGVLAERTMFWGDQKYGGHTGKAIKAARTQWYLAEGNAGAFQTWILLANATSQEAHVRIRYLLPGGGTITGNYTVDPNSRYTVFANAVPGLSGKSFSSDIYSDVPITVERSMYFGDNPFWTGGHVVAAVEAPSTEWFVAEGRTGPFFDTFLLLANPGATAANVTVRFLLPGGAYRDATYTLSPYSREDLWLDAILESQYGITDTDVSARITSTNGVPIIAERAMYWPSAWSESHGSAGVTTAGTLWALAEGELGTSLGYDTYILIANPSGFDATVKVTVLRPSGVPTVTTITVPANSRSTQQATMIGAQPTEQFGLLIESTNDVPIVVERAMYWNGGGQFWGGGTNETAFRLR